MAAESAHKAWAGAMAGAAVALINIITVHVAGDSVGEELIAKLGAAFGTVADMTVTAAIAFVAVYFGPRNRPTP